MLAFESGAFTPFLTRDPAKYAWAGRHEMAGHRSHKMKLGSIVLLLARRVSRESKVSAEMQRDKKSLCFYFSKLFNKRMCCDVHKTTTGSGRMGLGFLIGVLSLASLSLNGFPAEVQVDKKPEQRTGNPQQRKDGSSRGFSSEQDHRPDG